MADVSDYLEESASTPEWNDSVESNAFVSSLSIDVKLMSVFQTIDWRTISELSYKQRMMVQYLMTPKGSGVNRIQL